MKHFIKKRPPTIVLLMLCSLAAILLVLSLAIYDYIQVKDISLQYMEPKVFMEHLHNNNVFVVCRTSSSDFIQFQLLEDVSPEMQEFCFEKKNDILMLNKDTWYETYVYQSSAFSNYLTEYGIIESDICFKEIDTTRLTSVSRLLVTFWLLGFLYLYFAKMMGMTDKGAFAEKYTVSTTSPYTFKDVIGHDEVISDIKDYINILTHTSDFRHKHIRQPKGILFSGPPGTGKTLMAKALAGEAGVPFIYFNSAGAIDMYVGAGARAIRSCFAKARKLSPCVLFIDELDAIGKSRDTKASKSTEDDQTLLALLQELDGFTETPGVLVIGATNCVDRLDSALLRAGRFDRQIVINPPRNRESRVKLLKHYTAEYSLADDVSMDSLAAQMQGFTGADIAAICNEAAIISVIRDSEAIICQEDFIMAIDKFLLKGNRTRSQEYDSDRWIVAYHEAGHAVATYLTGGTISRISVHGTTSGVGGYVMEEDKPTSFTSKQELYNKLIVMYAGRAAEQIEFGENNVSSGAANDIQKATTVIEHMLLAYGYDKSLGLLDYSRIISLGLADRSIIIQAMQEVSHNVYEETLTLLRNNFNKVKKLAEHLLAEEEVNGDAAVYIIESED